MTVTVHRARKRFGQHFLVSSEVTCRIIDLLGQTTDIPVVEIGPGRGALTLPLARRGFHLTAVEFDRDLIEPLNRLLEPYENVTIVNSDFLKFDPEENGLDRFALVGNIPYNITSPVIDWCVHYRSHLTRVILMVQKELAERITASPGNRHWSPLSIMTQLFFETACCFGVPPEAFVPPPEVHSAVVTLTGSTEPVPTNLESIEKVVRASFRQRRKTLTNNLVPQIISSADNAVRILESLELPTTTRAEELSIEQFLKLTACLQSCKLI